jgi:hypothetical protein
MFNEYSATQGTTLCGRKKANAITETYRITAIPP